MQGGQIRRSELQIGQAESETVSANDGQGPKKGTRPTLSCSKDFFAEWSWKRQKRGMRKRENTLEGGHFEAPLTLNRSVFCHPQKHEKSYDCNCNRQ